MDKALTFLSEHPAIVWTGASLALGGLLLYWSHNTRNDVVHVEASISSLEELFFRGTLTEALKLHADEGAPLLLVIEDRSNTSETLRKQIWTDPGVQRLLGRPLIAIRMAHESKDGRFARQLVARSPAEVTQLPLLLIFRHGQTRALSMCKLLGAGGHHEVQKTRDAVRNLLSRIAREAALSRTASRDGTAEQAQQRQAEQLRLMRGDWEVVQLVKGGHLNLRDIIPDAVGAATATPGETEAAPPAASSRTAVPEARPASGELVGASSMAHATATASHASRSVRGPLSHQAPASWHQTYGQSPEAAFKEPEPASAVLRQQQDSAYKTSLAKDRQRAEERRVREEREQEEADAAELEAAVALSHTLSKKADLERARTLIPPEPTADAAGTISSFVFRLPDGSRLERRFDAAGALETVFHYLDVKLAERDPPIVNYCFTAYPHRSFSKAESDLQADLQTSGLTGRVAVFVRDLES